MNTLSGIMSNQSQREYLESARARYPNRNRTGKSAMINEICDTFGWSRKHTIKALNGQVSLGEKANKRGNKTIYGSNEQDIIVDIWKSSEQPCGILLKETIPLWLESYEVRNGKIAQRSRLKILKCSPRQLDRITKPHKVDSKRYGRRTGRTSHRLKTSIPVQCGPWEVDQPGWLEADTVSHGGASSSGSFMWSLTLTDIHTGWTELHGLWGNRGSEVCVGLRAIEDRMPFEMLGFDCDNGSEFLNDTLESYLRSPNRNVKWTRSRPYKKNDQAHVEQKNFTHVRQLLGYGRFDNLEVVHLVNELYQNTWLPLRNYFTPVMKLIKKTRNGSRVKKTYDTARTPCDRLLDCSKVNDKCKVELRNARSNLNPYELAEDLDTKLKVIFELQQGKEEQRSQEERWLEEDEEPKSAAEDNSTPASVAIAPYASVELSSAENLEKQA